MFLDDVVGSVFPDSVADVTLMTFSEIFSENFSINQEEERLAKKYIELLGSYRDDFDYACGVLKWHSNLFTTLKNNGLSIFVEYDISGGKSSSYDDFSLRRREIIAHLLGMTLKESIFFESSKIYSDTEDSSVLNLDNQRKGYRIFTFGK